MDASFVNSNAKRVWAAVMTNEFDELAVTDGQWFDDVLKEN
jgi:hypothetical protein